MSSFLCLLRLVNAFCSQIGDDAKWFTVAPFVRIIRKFTSKPLGDFLEALVAEEWAVDWDDWEDDNLDNLDENEMFEIDSVCYNRILVLGRLCAFDS